MLGDPELGAAHALAQDHAVGERLGRDLAHLVEALVALLGDVVLVHRRGHGDVEAEGFGWQVVLQHQLVQALAGLGETKFFHQIFLAITLMSNATRFFWAMWRSWRGSEFELVL